MSRLPAPDGLDCGFRGGPRRRGGLVARGVLVRQVHAAGGSLSQCSKTLHFGLGDRGEVDRVEIRWPSGLVQHIESPALNRSLEVVEPAAEAVPP